MPSGHKYPKTELNPGWLKEGTGYFISRRLIFFEDISRNFVLKDFEIIIGEICNVYMTAMALAKRTAIICVG